MIENVFIIMPAYNAGATIEGVFARIPEEVRSRIKKYIVVNDGSVDDTAQALARLQGNYANLEVLEHPVNQGYGAAEKTLLNAALEAGAEAAILLHSDGQYSPEKIPLILDIFDRGEAELVQGSRLLEGNAWRAGMPLYKYLANRWLTAIENLVLGMGLAEYHSGYMAYSRSFLDRVPFTAFSDTFEFDLEMIVAAKVLEARLKELPIPTIYGEEVSHLNPIKYGLDVLAVIRLFRRGHYHNLISGAAVGPTGGDRWS